MLLAVVRPGETICSPGWFIFHLSSAWPAPWRGTEWMFYTPQEQSSTGCGTVEGPCLARPSSAPSAPAVSPWVPLVGQRLPEADATAAALLLQ